MTEHELSWLAGLLEGEGSFILTRRLDKPTWAPLPTIAVMMTDEDVIRHVHAVAAIGRVYGPYSYRKHPDWTPLWRWTVLRQPALRLMDRLYPLMGQRRRAQIDTVRKGMVTLPLAWPVEENAELDEVPA